MKPRIGPTQRAVLSALADDVVRTPDEIAEAFPALTPTTAYSACYRLTQQQMVAQFDGLRFQLTARGHDIARAVTAEDDLASAELRSEFERQLVAHTDASDPTGCWLWTGGQNGEGYGLTGFRVNGRQVGAHRLSYLLRVGPIPDGHQIDHLCRVRHCLNPAHLEAVTQGENLRRGNSPAMIARRTNICQRGHDLSQPGVAYVRSNGTRVCRPCRALVEGWSKTYGEPVR